MSAIEQVRAMRAQLAAQGYSAGHIRVGAAFYRQLCVEVDELSLTPAPYQRMVLLEVEGIPIVLDDDAC